MQEPWICANVVLKPNKEGLIDLDGNYLLPPEYERLENWEQGFLRAYKKDNKGGFQKPREEDEFGKAAFLRWDGEWITDFKYNDLMNFYEGYASVAIKDKWGFIDTEGNEVVPCRYQSVGGMYMGWTHAKLDDKYGQIDLNGNWILPNLFDSPVNFGEDGLAIAEQKVPGTEKVKRYLMDKNLNEVQRLPDKWDWYEILAPGLLRFGKLPWYPEEGLWGLMDFNAKILIPPKFISDSSYFYMTGDWKEEKLLVYTQDGTYGYLDKAGNYQDAGPIPKRAPLEKEAPPAPFQKLGKFSEGLALACKNDLWGVIDENFETVIDFTLQPYDPIYNENKEGWTLQSFESKFQYGRLPICYFQQGNGQEGFLNTQGEPVIPPKFLVVKPFECTKP